MRVRKLNARSMYLNEKSIVPNHYSIIIYLIRAYSYQLYILRNDQNSILLLASSPSLHLLLRVVTLTEEKQ